MTASPGEPRGEPVKVKDLPVEDAPDVDKYAAPEPAGDANPVQEEGASADKAPEQSPPRTTSKSPNKSTKSPSRLRVAGIFGRRKTKTPPRTSPSGTTSSTKSKPKKASPLRKSKAKKSAKSEKTVDTAAVQPVKQVLGEKQQENNVQPITEPVQTVTDFVAAKAMEQAPPEAVPAAVSEDVDSLVDHIKQQQYRQRGGGMVPTTAQEEAQRGIDP
jgi:hypothetical protein